VFLIILLQIDSLIPQLKIQNEKFSLSFLTISKISFRFLSIFNEIGLVKES